MKTFFISLFALIALCSASFFTNYYYGGLYKVESQHYSGSKFQVFDFSRAGTKIRAKYFAENAYSAYTNWKPNKKVLFACAGAFSTDFSNSGRAVGLTVDNGVIVNRNLDNNMDGLIIIYNGGAQVGGVAVVDLESRNGIVKVGGGNEEYNVRDFSDKIKFLKWAEKNDATVFQTQLMYSSTGGYGFSSNKTTYGNKSTRRFLAVVQENNGTVHHLIIDSPDDSDYLNNASKKAVQMLQNKMNYTVIGLMNLDTGGKDIMFAYDDNGRTIDQARYPIHEATNLIVYYAE